MADDPKPATGDENKPDEQLGEAGKKALEAERKRANEAEKARKAIEKERDEYRQKWESYEADAKSDQEKAIEAARKEADTQARKEERERVNSILLKAEVRAAAAGKLADKEDAVRLLDLDSFEVKDDGAVDGEAISKAIEQLVESKPYLSAEGSPTPQGDPDGGTRQPAPRDVEPGFDRLVAAYSEPKT